MPHTNGTLPTASGGAHLKSNDRILRTAFQKEGYNRRIARKQPFLSAEAKAERLRWCLKMTELDKVGGLAESSFRGRVLYLCRKFTLECLGDQKPGEEFLENCIAPKVH